MISSGEYFLSSVFAIRTIITPPSPMNEKAGTSYYQMNFSPKYLIERKVLKMIAEIEFVDISTRSAKGSANICKTPPRAMTISPTIHFQRKKIGVCFDVGLSSSGST